MEHPAEPTWDPQAPSSWHLPELSATMVAPTRRPRPSVRAGTDAGAYNSGVSGPGKVHAPREGVDVQGNFRTAALKTYPPA
eukprot:558293-Pyramimonas_sp.AAC.1